MTTELTIRVDQAGFDAKQIAALEQLGVQNASRADQAIFFHQCVRTGLDPFARQVYMIERQGKQTIQTGIDGFRLIARRAADKRRESLGYSCVEWCGDDGEWRDVWLASTPPRAARVTVFRAGEPFPAVAHMDEFRAVKRDGNPMAQWASKPRHMLAKCAEALALRMAFPQDLSGLHTTDEMGTDLPEDGDAPAPAATAVRRMSRRSAEPPPDVPPDEPHGTSEPDAITEPQLKLLQAHYKDIDRDARLAEASEVLGVEVVSFSALSKQQASRLIEWINGPDGDA